MNTIYTIGYATLTPARLAEIAAAKNAMIVDIRYSPRSRRPEWDKEQLVQQFGGEYMHVPALGNRNYSNDGPIELAAPHRGFSILDPVLQKRSIILLCQCRDWRECHRKHAAEYLSEATGKPIQHIEPEAETKAGTIKVLSLTPPWGTLVAIGAKHFETRSWSTSYRGLLAIHQTKGLADMNERDLLDIMHSEPFYMALARARCADPADLPRGAIVAVADLRDCVRTEEIAPLLSAQERAFGNYAPGRWVWKLENVHRLRQPLPARGAQGLWQHDLAPIEALLEG